MKKYVVGGAFLLLIIIAIYLSGAPGGKKTEVSSPVPTPQAASTLYENFNFETASASAVLSRLGSPLRSDTYKGVTTYIYPTTEKGRNISVEVYENGSIKRIIQPQISKQQFSSVASGFGAADMELYGKHEELGFRLYVYLSRGTALLANPTTQEVRERWYFPVMSGSAFEKELGVGLTTQHVEGKQ